jgi:hypothetical protein
MSYAVQRPLWEAMESVLMAQSKRLIKDIAETLGEDEKKLWTAFRLDKSHPYLVDLEEPTSENFKCSAFDTSTVVARICRKPVLFGERFCPAHRFWEMPSTLKNKPEYRRLTLDDSVYYVATVRDVFNTLNVYDVHNNRVGYFEDDTLHLFEITDEVV